MGTLHRRPLLLQPWFMSTGTSRLLLLVSCGLAIACGGDVAVPTDAGPPGLVSIQYTHYEGYVRGATAIFLNADDSVVAIELTDADGWARANMVAGGSVVLADFRDRSGSTGISADLAYYLDVEPGDVLVFGLPTFPDGTGSVEVRVPFASEGARYGVATCGRGGPALGPERVRITPDCAAGDAFVAAGLRSGEHHGSFLVRDVDFTLGPVDLSAEEYAPALVMTQTLYPVFDGIQPSSEAFVRVAGIPHLLAASGSGNACAYCSGGTFTGSSVSVNALVPSVEAEQLVVHTMVGIDDPDGPYTTRHVIESVAFTTDYTLDLDTIRIPVMEEAATLNGGGVIRWREGPGTAEWVYASFLTSAVDSPDHIVRFVVAPHRGMTEIRLPMLPDEYARLNPQPGLETETTSFTIGTSPGGYDAFRVGHNVLVDGTGVPRDGLERGLGRTMVDAMGERFVTSKLGRR